ncbi:MAG: thioredoxin [Candidatus Adiutrix sp.]|jgi:thioredoxin 1|nr:thioredoxin [Candidatus Adiutrix sp.]
MSSVSVLTDANFDSEIKNSPTPVLVDFWAPWCGPCKAVAPILEELSGELQGRLNIAKVNVDENQAVAARFGVRSIPTMVVIKNGEVLERIVGSRPKHDLKAALERHL